MARLIILLISSSLSLEDSALEINSKLALRCSFRRLVEAGDATYRPAAQSLLTRSFESQISDPTRSLEECAHNLIEAMHHRTSWVPEGNIIGTTLRLKGLEFDRVLIMNPASIQDRKHLYVALTRPSRELILVIPED